MLLYNGNFIRFGSENNYNWILINKSIIADAGYGNEYKKYYYCDIERIDLKGRTVLPGFYDCHVHFIQTALHANGLDMNGAHNFEDIGNRITNWILKYPNKVLIKGYGLEVDDLEEKKLPGRRILDKYSKDYGIVISSRDFHTCILNTKALNMLKVPLNLEGLDRDDLGNPSGVVYSKVNALIRKKIFQSYHIEDKIQSIKMLAENVTKKGVTSIHAMEGGYDFYDNDAELLQSYISSFPIDILLYYSKADILKVKSMGLNRIGGDIYADGSFTSMSAAISYNYRNSDKNGNLYFSQNDINNFLLECYKKSLDTSIHAVGDRAVDQVLNAHEYAQKNCPNNKLRHRIEHAEITSHELRKKAYELGIIFSMQPAFEYFYGGAYSMYSRRLGPGYRYTNQLRQIIDDGITICGGSDSDLTPIDPLLGIHAAVNHPVPDSRVTVEEAVKMFTINAAYSVHEENEKGSIDIGKVADLVILEKDIYKINPKAIVIVPVIGTVKNGEFLYKNFKLEC